MVDLTLFDLTNQYHRWQISAETDGTVVQGDRIQDQAIHEICARPRDQIKFPLRILSGLLHLNTPALLVGHLDNMVSYLGRIGCSQIGQGQGDDARSSIAKA